VRDALSWWYQIKEDSMTMDKPRSKKANALHQNVKNYAELRHPGVLDIRFHSFSDGEVIG
jgi:hypothetical protein